MINFGDGPKYDGPLSDPSVCDHIITVDGEVRPAAETQIAFNLSKISEGSIAVYLWVKCVKCGTTWKMVDDDIRPNKDPRSLDDEQEASVENILRFRD